MLGFLMFILGSLGTLWYLDTNHYHWSDEILNTPKTLIQNLNYEINEPTYYDQTRQIEPTNEWKPTMTEPSRPTRLNVPKDLNSRANNMKSIDYDETDSNNTKLLDDDTGSNNTKLLDNENTGSNNTKLIDYDDTGLNNTKSIDYEDTGSNNTKLLDDENTGSNNTKLINYEENSKTLDLSVLDSNTSEKYIEAPTRGFDIHSYKTYEQIKDNLKKMNVVIKTEVEMMDDLTIEFKEQLKLFKESNKNLRIILSVLEKLSNKVETEDFFVKNNGIESIILPCINSNSEFLNEQGALLLGSAASNNPKVQISALNAGLIPILLNHICDKYEFSVQKSCFYALAAVTRHFPNAQKEVIEKDGIQILLNVFKRPKSDSNTILKLKLSQLLQDLVIEIDDAELTAKEETNEQLSLEAKQRVEQYSELHMKETLVENGWCNILGNELIDLSSELPKNQNNSFDMVEALSKSLLDLNKLCKAKLQGNKQLYKALIILTTYYKELFQKDKFYNTLYQLMNELTNTYDPVLE